MGRIIHVELDFDHFSDVEKTYIQGLESNGALSEFLELVASTYINGYNVSFMNNEETKSDKKDKTVTQQMNNEEYTNLLKLVLDLKENTEIIKEATLSVASQPPVVVATPNITQSVSPAETIETPPRTATVKQKNTFASKGGMKNLAALKKMKEG